jgi:hypothetical protein
MDDWNMDGWNIASNIPLLNASTHLLDHDPLPASLHAHMLADGKNRLMPAARHRIGVNREGAHGRSWIMAG